VKIAVNFFARLGKLRPPEKKKNKKKLRLDSFFNSCTFSTGMRKLKKTIQSGFTPDH
jgi:hypothetical protein